MNEKIKKILINSGYLVSSNLMSMLVSILVVLILPKIIGIRSYGYWQLYLFYVSYVGFFHLGWIDGIYLKYGGYYFEKLNKKKFFSQFISYFIFQLAITIVILIYSLLCIHEENRQFIFFTVAITLLITNLRFFTIYLLQTTNLIKQSSIITIIDRVAYFLLLLGLLVVGVKNYQYMIYVDIVARMISLIYGIYLCREIVINKLTLFKFDFYEIVENIKIGSNLMLSNIASLLIIGIVRLGIEKNWNIETFGKVSLTLSISNLLMVFINAIGIAIFPILKRTDEKQLASIYKRLNHFLTIILLGLLTTYFPLKIILLKLLPNYKDSIEYMVLIFPMAVFEGKMSLLINTYLKALRLEKYILRVNIITVCCSLISTLFLTFIFKNLEFSVLSILILLIIRCLLAERVVSNRLEIKVTQDSIIEIMLTVIFIISNVFFSSVIAIFIYLVFYVVYLTFKRKELLFLKDLIVNFRKNKQ
ncbi:MAG: hypothetical protein Q4A87_02825 [Streptococcus sp.]|nr:hypothetical protein [Streptococcus sp.]